MNYFNTVKFFLHVAEVGSFTQAANDLGTKTSTISRHIAQLEKELGIALINRTTRGMTLTEGGRVFYENVKPGLEMIDNAREAAALLNKHPTGDLRLSVCSAFYHTYIAPNLKEFSTRYPNIRILISIDDSPPDLVEKGIDLSIQAGSLTSSTSMARKLLSHWYVACCSLDWMEKHDAVSNLENFKSQDVMLGRPELSQNWYALTPSQYTLFTIKSHYSFNNEIALFEAIRHGAGVGILPYWLVEKQLQSGELMHVLPGVKFSPTSEAASVWAIYSFKKTVSSKVRSLIDFLVEKV